MSAEINLDTGIILAILAYLAARTEAIQKTQNKIKTALLKVHPELEKVFQ